MEPITYLAYQHIPLGYLQAGELVVREELKGIEILVAVLAAKQTTH